jgi:cell division protein ZapA (FtsZ GTPase activity inhibitor)
LAERVHAELEATLLQPRASQCRSLEQAAPAVNEALEHLENSTRQLRSYHFKSILAAMLISCLVIAGGCFALGWSKLSHHYELKVKAALERVVSVDATNEETFTQLTKMNVPIRVVPVASISRNHLRSSPWW